jgi:hypothetical protein
VIESFKPRGVQAPASDDQPPGPELQAGTT